MCELMYYHSLLIVDKAWVDSRNGRMIVEIEGRLYTIELPVVRQEGGRQVDEGDLLPMEVENLPADVWSLTSDDVRTRFRIISRATMDRMTHAYWPLVQ